MEFFHNKSNFLSAFLFQRKHLDLLETIRLKKGIKARVYTTGPTDGGGFAYEQTADSVKVEPSNGPLKILHKKKVDNIIYHGNIRTSSQPKLITINSRPSTSSQSVASKVIKVENRPIKVQQLEMTDDEMLTMEEHIIEHSYGDEPNAVEHENNNDQQVEDIDLSNVTNIDMIDDPLEEFQFGTNAIGSSQRENPLFKLKQKLIERQIEVLEAEHQLRMEVLKADLHHKRMEHQKTMQYLRMKYEK